MNIKVRKEYVSADANIDDFWSDFTHLNDYAPDMRIFSLMNGETVLTDQNLVLISGNEFSENLRFSSAGVVYLERSPYIYLTHNRFHSNSNLEVARLAASLSEFVEKALGLRGVTGLGNYDQITGDSVRMLPLIYSNLGLSLVMQDNSADSNSVFAGTNKLGNECATSAEFTLLAAKSPQIQNFSILRPS